MNLSRLHSNNETLVHLVKGAMGTGVLAMPNAFHFSGYVVGSIGTIVAGIVCTYCMHMLLRSAHELSKRRKVKLSLLVRSLREYFDVIFCLIKGTKSHVSRRLGSGFWRRTHLVQMHGAIYRVRCVDLALFLQNSQFFFPLFLTHIITEMLLTVFSYSINLALASFMSYLSHRMWKISLIILLVWRQTYEFLWLSFYCHSY